MGVRDEDIAEFQKLAGRQMVQIAEIEEECFMAVFASYVNSGVSERFVYELGAVHRNKPPSFMAGGFSWQAMIHPFLASMGDAYSALISIKVSECQGL
jgi:hypothetical protein